MSSPSDDPVDSVDALLARATGGDRRAVGRLVSLVERGGPPAEQVARAVGASGRRAHVVGVTGAPGAGKSTLTGHLAARLAVDGGPVAVLAVDPSSPLSGGAILGDRVRMDPVVPGHVFVRSMASRGNIDGLARAVPAVLRLLGAVGFDVVVLETVGVGQVETEIAGAADTTVVVVTPGWGDAIQANKAGLLELADVFVVNKADRPGADGARRDLVRMLDLGSRPSAWEPPVLSTVATHAVGVGALIDAIRAHRHWLDASGRRAVRARARLTRELEANAVARLATRVARALATPAGEAIVDSAAGGGRTLHEAAADLVELVDAEPTGAPVVSPH